MVLTFINLVSASCRSPLGLEDGRIHKDDLRVSSSHEPSSVGAHNARLNVDTAGGAWCPRGLIDKQSRQFIEVDLKQPHLVTSVKTQGRFGNGHGQEFAEQFLVEYWRKGINFTVYQDRDGKKILKGNTNTYSVVETVFDSPFVAEKIRIYPYSEHPRMVCMRIEILGCLYTGKSICLL